MPNKKKKDQKKFKEKKVVYLSQPFDFKEDVTWRIFRIMSEFIDGFQFLADLKKEVTFFGSARVSASNEYYKQARQLCRLLGKSGFTIITGGGPGIMEAANQGAFETGAESVGLNIQLPFEQRINPFVKKGIGFHYFFTRKVMLSASAQAYIFFPGGFGTLDEFFEMTMLIQTKKMETIPIILVGQEYWGPLLDWINNVVYGKFKNIDREDMKIYTLVDNIQEAYEIIRKTKERKYF
ncbi:MAG TPA: TIGR00730 family Rossman fold protein [Patescibacteria group bacterium]